MYMYIHHLRHHLFPRGSLRSLKLSARALLAGSNRPSVRSLNPGSASFVHNPKTLQSQQQQTPKSWNMGLGRSMLVFLLFRLWSWRTFLFSLHGFYCKTLTTTPVDSYYKALYQNHREPTKIVLKVRLKRPHCPAF